MIQEQLMNKYRYLLLCIFILHAGSSPDVRAGDLTADTHDSSSPDNYNVNDLRAGQLVDLLRQSGVDPVILHDKDHRKQVILAPGLVGRVMGTSMDGDKGRVAAWINDNQIRKGFTENWNNFGGAERIWFVPEGGKFGLHFPPGVDQAWKNIRSPPAINKLHYQILGKPAHGRSVRFSAPVGLSSYHGRRIELEITRRVEILEDCPYTLGQGDHVDFVGFESRTQARNTGAEPLDRSATPVGLWILGMFKCEEHTVLMLPFHTGLQSELGEPVTREYFRYVCRDGKMNQDYWQLNDGCVLVKANGNIGTKIEMFKRRSLGRMASLNLETYELVIVDFNLVPEMDYIASFFHPYSGDPYDGGVMSIYVNEGEIGNPQRPAFYELESCSPILELGPDETYNHESRTWRIQGKPEIIQRICKKYFNVGLAELKKFDQRSMESGL
jgi:hypothetical protein